MKRTFFAMAAVAASLVAVFFLGMHCGKCNSSKQSIGNRISTNGPIASDQHKRSYRYGYIAQIEPLIEPSVFKQDFFSSVLHWGAATQLIMNWESISDINNASHHPKQNGQINYYIEWDDSKKCFRFNEPCKRDRKEIFSIFLADS
jgi:hypothetical protein